MGGGRFRAAPELEAESAGSGALAVLLGARVHVDVKVPRTQVRGRMRLLVRGEALGIAEELRRDFGELGLLLKDGTVLPLAYDEWKLEVAVRHLAIAVRDPADETKPLDDLAAWRECDDEQIAFLWGEYQDLRQRIDPLGEPVVLSDEDLAAMHAAVKKKDADLLTSYGSLKLAAFAISTAAPPAS